ncbi:MAG: DinB family protein [Blastocatellia bacterium]
MIENFLKEYQTYRRLGLKAIEQVSDDALNKVLGADNNSIAVIVRHINGNLRSRFTDFLTSDGEKSWRDRDSEFADTTYDRQAIESMWAEGFQVVEDQLNAMTAADLERLVTIRGEPHTVHQALCRSVAHTAYHVGQIVLLARILTEGDWQSLSIPRGQSQVFNSRLMDEKKPQ